MAEVGVMTGPHECSERKGTDWACFIRSIQGKKSSTENDSEATVVWLWGLDWQGLILLPGKVGGDGRGEE